MLVTIASNNDNDASHFTNDFPEGLIIPKNASIGVVNCSYILREGFTIQTGLNDVFQIKLGNMVNFIDVTVAAGSYSTLTDLAVAVQAAIATAIGTQSVFIQACYPVAEQTAVGDDQASTLTIHFIFDLASQAGDFFTVGTNAFFKDPAKIIGNLGGFMNNIVNQDLRAPLDSTVRTSDGGANQNFLVPTHKNATTGSYEALFKVEYQSNGKQSEMLLKTSADQLPDVCPIQVLFSGANQVEIYEMIGGVRTQINSGTQAIVAGNTVEIRIPEIDPNQQQQIVASYFITAGGNTTEIPVVAPAAGRRSISQYDEFIPALEFIDNSITGKVPFGAKRDNAVSLFNITNDGTGYEPGDFLTQSATTGAGAGVTFFVVAVSVTGDLVTLELNNTGAGYGGGEVVTLQGGSGNGAQVTIGATSSTHTVTSGGTGYVQGAVLDVVGGTGIGAQFTLTTVNAGVVQVVNCTTPGSGYSDGDALQLVGGSNNCIINIGVPQAERNRLINARATLIGSPMNQRPLVLKRDISMKTGTFNQIFNGKARYDDLTGNKTIESGKIVSNNRAASNIHIQVNNFGPIESREKGSNGKTVAVVPLGDNTNTASGLFNNELFNIVYHKLENPEPLNNNELTVRLTDFQSNTLPSLKHPVTVTFDIKPDIV